MTSPSRDAIMAIQRLSTKSAKAHAGNPDSPSFMEKKIDRSQKPKESKDYVCEYCGVASHSKGSAWHFDDCKRLDTSLNITHAEARRIARFLHMAHKYGLQFTVCDALSASGWLATKFNQRAIKSELTSAAQASP